MPTRPLYGPDLSLSMMDGMFESAPFGLALCDIDLRYIRVNEQFASHNLVRPEQHVGRRIHEVRPELNSVIDEIRSVLERGEPIIGQYVPGEQRHDVPMLISMIPVQRDEEIVGLTMIVDDSGDDLDKYAQLLRHRIANPLTVIRGGLQTLRDVDLTPGDRETLLQAMIDQADLLHELSLDRTPVDEVERRQAGE
jgi:signal transduction histidine kinase